MKTVVVNGGSRGIGASVAIALARDSNNMVIVTGRSEGDLKKVEASGYGRVVAIKSDLTLQAERSGELTSYLRREKRGVDVLINSIGLLIKKPFEETTAEEAISMLETNLIAPSMAIRELLPLFNRNAHIVNIGSMGGYQGSIKFPGMAWYSASKGSLAIMTEALAAELEKDEIRVNCVCPGAVQTEMLEKAFPGYKAPVTAEEMADFLCWFAMKGNKFFNGKVLPLSTSTP